MSDPDTKKAEELADARILNRPMFLQLFKAALREEWDAGYAKGYKDGERNAKEKPE